MDFIEEDIADKQPKEIRVFLEKYVSEKTGIGSPNQLNTLHRPQLGGYRYPSNYPIGG